MSSEVTVVADELLAWFVTDGRDLPWRRERDPWAVLVAEVMLQQTRVERVIGRWEEFLERWPDPAACAAAPLEDLLRFWDGLGYPRRARNLREAARIVVARHHGAVPSEVEVLRTLPGVGPYTARAVAAFAHEHDVGVLDTNVGRILARLAGRSLGGAEAQELADALVPAAAGWAWNQAMIDLGAGLCTRRSPRCGGCPIARGCRWRGAGPDPADASAAVSGPQAPYRGSNRQLRGEILRLLQQSSRHRRDLAEHLGNSWTAADVARAVTSLVADGLACESDGLVEIGA